ncbi:MAG: hemolysin family protein [candidate division WOR-3 bacterium]|nr:hemolysin family protein [candidate division WOR-3 bacterium]
MILTVAAALFLLMFSFFFTSSEMAFVASSKLITLVKHKQNKWFDLLYRMLSKPEIYLYTVLVGNNLANALITIILGNAFLAGRSVGNSFFFSLALSSIILIVGEIIPKTITKENPENYAVFYAPFIRFFYYLFLPLIFISTSLSEILFYFAKIKDRDFAVPKLTKSDLYYFVKGHADERETTGEEERIISGIFEFREKPVIEIMVPKPEIFMISRGFDFDELKREMFDEEKIYTRIPVYSPEDDTVKGILNINDFIIDRDKIIDDIVSEPFFAPETISLSYLLADMRKRNEHMSIIVDEYGSLVGLVTLEDIVEELIGDIEDEYDPQAENDFERGKLIVSGEMRVEDINEMYIINLPENNAYETIAGLIMYRTGIIPEEGSEIRVGSNILLRVINMNGKKPGKIELIRED